MHTYKKTLFASIIIGLVLLLSGIVLITPITAAHAESAVLLSGTDSAHTPASVKAESTSNLTFNLINNGQEYKVSALNRSLTEAIIPSQYNGLPVTEISDNGFMACSSLQKVFVPETVKRIGTNAFMNCAKLKNVIGMSSVTSYGNAAFSMCTSLENLILPSGATSLGTYMIRNVPGPVYVRSTEAEMESINPNWNFNGNIVYGNSIVYRPYTNAEGVSGYEIQPWQNLEPSNEPLVIYSWCYYDINDDIGAPLLNIGQWAFQFYNVPSITIKHPENSNLSHSINIESYAFVGVDANNVDIEVDITLNDAACESGLAEGLFANSQVKSVTLPDSIDVIPSYAFAYCYNLTEIKNTNANVKTNHLSDKITRIDSYAFIYAYSIPELYIQNTIEYIGDYAFSYWGTLQTPMQYIYIDLVEAPKDMWSNYWDHDVILEGCSIEFIGATEYTVNFITAQNGVVNPIGGSSKVVLPKSTLNDIADIPNPTSASHDFTGIWYTTEECTPGTEFAFDKPIKQNLNLYAGWQIKEFDISFTDNKYFEFYEIGGDLLSKEIKTFKYGQTFQFYIVMNDGYENPTIGFDSQVLIPSTGSKIYTITVTGEAGFNINADLITYTINYENLRDGTNPNTLTSYTIESETINFVAPEWKAYDGRTWDVTSIPNGSWGDKTITAVWTNPVTFTISYENLRDGTNPNTVTSYTIESLTINFAAPEWEAYDGRTWDITSIPNGSWGNKTITAVWTNPVTYTITYTNLRSGVNPNTLTFYTVESETINFAAPEWEAYDGRTWDITSIPTGSWGNKTISAVWTNPVTFTITYNNVQYGINPSSNPTTYTIETPTITFDNPTWEAYNNGVWDAPNISNGSWGDKTVTAIWSNPATFTITYENLQGGTHNNTVTSYRIDSDTITFENPSWQAYYNGTWDFTNIPKGSWGDKTITAVWSKPVPFKITYNGVLGGINPSTNPKTYNVETAEIVFANPLWAAYNNGRWDTATIPRGSWGDKTISAIWSNPVEFSITYFNIQNGTNSSSNPTTYTIETPTITFAGASRLGYPNSTWDVTSIPQGTWGTQKITAVWSEPHKYYITYNNLQGGQNPNTRLTYTVEDYVTFTNPTKYGYIGTWDISSIQKGSTGDKTITAVWTYNMYNLYCYAATTHATENPYTFWLVKEYNKIQDIRNENVSKGETHSVYAPDINGYTFKRWEKVDGNSPYWFNSTDGLNTNTSLVTESTTLNIYDPSTYEGTALYIAIYEKNACVAEGTLITLADGTQKPVEQLTANDRLLVWNLKTGAFDSAPILFIDSDSASMYEVINLYFSDGTTVKVISEHGFWDFDLNQYVFLRNDAAKYIGHYFNKQITNADGNMEWTKVQLVNVVVHEEYTSAWSPVTYGYLCYYVNGMLSMPGATEGLINIFDVNPDTMKIDEEKYNADVTEYGLFTYEEFAEIIPVPEIVFDAFGGKYFKVAMGKGLLDWETIEALVERYVNFF